jgi:hypothetical protein
LYFIRKFFPSYSPYNRGPELRGLPYPPPGGTTKMTTGDIRELPLAIQDRVFANNSHLWYPVLNATDAGVDPLPNGVQPPKWIPEFLFDGTPNPMMMTVNGRTWPKRVSELAAACLFQAAVLSHQQASCDVVSDAFNRLGTYQQAGGFTSHQMLSQGFHMAGNRPEDNAGPEPLRLVKLGLAAPKSA